METYKISAHAIFVSTQRGKIILVLEGAAFLGLPCFIYLHFTGRLPLYGHDSIILYYTVGFCFFMGGFLASVIKRSLFVWLFFRKPPEKVVKQYKKQLVDGFKKEIAESIQTMREMEKENIKREGIITYLSS